MEILPHYLWIGFTGGVLAFAHCLGMCGGFVLHLSREPDRRRMISTHLLWQSGRITTYIFFGAVAGFTGGIVENMLDYTRFQNLLGYATGTFILVMGINLLGLLPARVTQRMTLTGSMLSGICSRMTNSSSTGAAFFLGMITGCLPCPVVLAFLAYALQTGSVWSGMGTMAAVGCGTMLPLVLVGMAGRWVQLWDWGARVGGVILVLLGLSTILRCTELHHSIGDCSCGFPPVHTATPEYGSRFAPPEQVRNALH